MKTNWAATSLAWRVAASSARRATWQAVSNAWSL